MVELRAAGTFQRLQSPKGPAKSEPTHARMVAARPPTPQARPRFLAIEECPHFGVRAGSQSQGMGWDPAPIPEEISWAGAMTPARRRISIHRACAHRCR